MHIVIGSGPAGVACANALLARGSKVLMLDAGIELEPERAEVVSALGRSAFAAWKPDQVRLLKGNMAATARPPGCASFH